MMNEVDYTQVLQALYGGIRILFCVFLSPILSESYLPNNVKAVVFMMIVFVGSSVISQSSQTDFTFSCAYQEVIIGLFLGLTLKIGFSVLTILGTMVAQSMSISQIFGTNNTQHMPAISHFFNIGGMILLLITGYIPLLLKFILLSFEAMPLCGEIVGSDVVFRLVSNLDDMFALSFILAMPFVVMSMIYNVMIGVINRAMPQMMVSLVGAPLITFLGIFVLMMSIVMILQRWLPKFYETMMF